jgi:hypothetical protein
MARCESRTFMKKGSFFSSSPMHLLGDLDEGRRVVGRGVEDRDALGLDLGQRLRVLVLEVEDRVEERRGERGLDDRLQVGRERLPLRPC